MNHQTRILFFDVETGGLSPYKNGIHQISGKLYCGTELVESFNCHVKPFPQDQIEDKSLAVSGKTRADLQSDSHFTPEQVYKSIIKMLGKYCNKFTKTDKIFLGGYNNATFDNEFLRKFFEKNGDTYFGSWFWSAAIDVMILASEKLKHDRHEMKDFKLGTVAAWLNVEGYADTEKLHEAGHDIDLTIRIYNAVTGSNLAI